MLDADHYALEKVKDRIIEYLAVQARTNKLKGPILCLVGPPGVGKTSPRQVDRQGDRPPVRAPVASAACATRPEIRGHRRTYIGSLPGKIVTNLKKTGTSNPLFLLDEIDKLRPGLPRRSRFGAARGARSGAEQRSSRIITSSSTSTCRTSCSCAPRIASTCRRRCSTAWRSSGSKAIPRTRRSKIAERHLIAKQIEAHGLKPGEFTLEPTPRCAT